MGRIDLDIRLRIGERQFQPTVIAASGKGDLYVILRLPGLGPHFSRHGDQREHIKVPALDEKWTLDRTLSDEEREALRNRFAYQPTGNHVVYLVPIPAVAGWGGEFVTVKPGRRRIDIALDEVLANVPYGEIDGIRACNLDSYLEESEHDRLLGLDFQNGCIVAAKRERGEWLRLGLPIDLPSLVEELDGTSYEEGLLEPVFGSAEVVLEYITRDAEQVQSLRADIEMLSEIVDRLAHEFYERLEEEVGSSWHPSE